MAFSDQADNSFFLLSLWFVETCYPLLSFSFKFEIGSLLHLTGSK